MMGIYREIIIILTLPCCKTQIYKVKAGEYVFDIAYDNSISNQFLRQTI